MRNQLQRGFTLIEILISTFVIGLIAIVLFNIYTGYYTVFAIQQARLEVNGSAREVVEEFRKTALQANRVLLSRSFSGVTYTSGATTTVFELPAVSSTGSMLSGIYDYVVFYATSTEVYKVVEGGAGSVRASSTRHLSSTLSSLVITYNNSNVTLATSTDIDIQTRAIVKEQTYQAHVHETARLRNI